MLIPENFCQVNFFFEGVGVPTGAQCTLALKHDQSGDTPAEVAETMAAIWQASNIDSQQSSSVTMTKVLVKFGPNATGPSAEFDANTPGTASADCETPNTSYLIHKNTDFGGRQGRGRMYIPGPPTAAVGGNGIIVALNVTNLQTALDTFYADCITASYLPALLHAEGAPVQLPYTVNSFTVDGKAATQRRRLRR